MLTEEELAKTIMSERKAPSRVLGVSVYVSAISILFVLFAVFLPVDQASQIVDAPAAAAKSTRVSSNREERPTPNRGKSLGDTLKAKDLYEAYKEVEREYHTIAFQQGSQWKLLASKDNVQVSLMEHSSDESCPYVKMVAIIPASVQECWSWLSLENWSTNMPKMDPFYEGVELHGAFEHKGVSMILARKRTKRILAFGKRDMVFLSVSDQPLSDGTWVSGSVSVQTGRIPREKGYTRAFQDSIAFYKPLSGNTRTELTIVCRIDLNDSSEDGSGGWIPMWMYVKTVGATGLRSVTSMRDIIVEEKQTQKLVDSEANTTSMPMSTENPLKRLWKRSREACGIAKELPNFNQDRDLKIPGGGDIIGNTGRSAWKLPWARTKK